MAEHKEYESPDHGGDEDVGFFNYSDPNVNIEGEDLEIVGISQDEEDNFSIAVLSAAKKPRFSTSSSKKRRRQMLKATARMKMLKKFQLKTRLAKQNFFLL